MARVMQPYIERREFRRRAEMTPETLRVFRERDRGLADPFHILPVRDPAEPESLRTLVEVTRQLKSC